MTTPQPEQTCPACKLNVRAYNTKVGDAPKLCKRHQDELNNELLGIIDNAQPEQTVSSKDDHRVTEILLGIVAPEHPLFDSVAAVAEAHTALNRQALATALRLLETASHSIEDPTVDTYDEDGVAVTYTDRLRQAFTDYYGITDEGGDMSKVYLDKCYLCGEYKSVIKHSQSIKDPLICGIMSDANESCGSELEQEFGHHIFVVTREQIESDKKAELLMYEDMAHMYDEEQS